MPATALGNTTPAPDATVLTTLICFAITVALPCTVPAADMPVPTLTNVYPLVVRLADDILPETLKLVSVPTLVIFGCAAVVTVPAVVALDTVPDTLAPATLLAVVA